MHHGLLDCATVFRARQGAAGESSGARETVCRVFAAAGWLLLAVALAAGARAADGDGGVASEAPGDPADPADPEEVGPELLGPVSRHQIEAVVPEWVKTEIEADPDREAAARLADALEGAEVTVYLGTWCEDSRRELARLWRALDEAGIFEPPQFAYVGVDRDKREPAELLAGSDLCYVPTFIVRRGAGEVGRIVESAPGGIERDLLALLSGERQGVLSGRDDLGAPAER